MASVASMLNIPEFLLLPPPPLPSSGTFMTAMEARTDWWGGRWEACCRYIPCRLLDHVPVVPEVPDPWDTWEGPLGRLGTASWDASGCWGVALGRRMTVELSTALLASSPVPF